MLFSGGGRNFKQSEVGPSDLSDCWNCVLNGTLLSPPPPLWQTSLHSLLFFTVVCSFTKASIKGVLWVSTVAFPNVNPNKLFLLVVSYLRYIHCCRKLMANMATNTRSIKLDYFYNFVNISLAFYSVGLWAGDDIQSLCNDRAMQLSYLAFEHVVYPFIGHKLIFASVKHSQWKETVENVLWSSTWY